MENDNQNKRKSLKLKKSVFIVLFAFIFIIGGIVYYVYSKKEELRQLEIKRLEQEKQTLELIKSHYNDVVKTNNDAKLFIKNGENYKEEGIVYKDVILYLDEITIDLNTKYFKIKDKDYYVSFENVDKSVSENVLDNRYKNYVPFNENIITKSPYTLYDGENMAYTFNETGNYPIIIKNFENKYYVEYDNKLYSIKSDDVLKTEKHTNTSKKNQSKITTLAYHQVGDSSDKCTDSYVCIKKENFDKEMKYLHDNNYFTLTMEELYMYLKGNLQIEKGVVLTFDDGYRTKNMIEIMEKYDLNGTIFIITSSFSNYSVFASKNLFLQSHGDNLHRNYVCSGGNQGGAILCMSKDNIKKDLNTSINKLKTEPIAFAYPFYDYNDKAIEAIKEVGFKMAFIGRGGVMGKATPQKTNLYKIPRMTVWDTNLMSFNTWKSYL